MVIWLGLDIIRQQIGSKKEGQKRNAQSISQIIVDCYVKKQRITAVFSRNALYMHFFEIGSIYAFSILELLKLPKIAQISTPVRLYCAFLVGGKMAVSLAVVLSVVSWCNIYEVRSQLGLQFVYYVISRAYFRQISVDPVHPVLGPRLRLFEKNFHMKIKM